MRRLALLLPLLVACAVPVQAEDPTPTPSPHKLADRDEGNIFFSGDYEDIYSLHPRMLLLPLNVGSAFTHCASVYALNIYKHPMLSVDLTWGDDECDVFVPVWQRPIGLPSSRYYAALSEAFSTIETGDYTPLGEVCPDELADFETYDGI